MKINNWPQLLPENSGALYGTAIRAADYILSTLPEGKPGPTVTPSADGSVTLSWPGLTIDCDSFESARVTSRPAGATLGHTRRERLNDIHLDKML